MHLVSLLYTRSSLVQLAMGYNNCRINFITLICTKAASHRWSPGKTRGDAFSESRLSCRNPRSKSALLGGVIESFVWERGARCSYEIRYVNKRKCDCYTFYLHRKFKAVSFNSTTYKSGEYCGPFERKCINKTWWHFVIWGILEPFMLEMSSNRN